MKDYNKLEDIGWQKMHSILDQKMPVKKQDRKLLMLLFLLFGLIVAVGLYKASLLKPVEKGKEPLPKLAYTEKYLDTEKQTNGKSKTMEMELPAIVKSESSYTELPSKTKKNILKQERKLRSAANNIEMLNPTSDPTILNTYNAENSMDHSRAEVKIDKEPGLAKPSDSKISNLEVNPLPVIAVDLKSSQASQELTFNRQLSIINPYKFIKPASHFQFGLQAGYSYYLSNSTSSIIAGFSTNYILSDKWSLECSPSLEIKKGNFLILNDNEQSIIINKLDSFQMNSDLFRTTPSEFQVFDSNISSKVSVIYKVNYLYTIHLPLCIQYHMNANWIASVGMKFSLPLQKDLLSLQKSNVMQWRNLYGNNLKVDLWKIHPVNLYLQSGIKYFPTHHIGISLDFAFALSESAGISDSSKTTTPIATKTIKFQSLNHLSTSMIYKF